MKLAYFGKVSSRGDFVRSAHHGALTQLLDQWLSQGLELLATDPRWKHFYDHAAPTHFAFLSTHSRQALAGHLVPSVDASGRRFPFVTTGAFEVEHPMSFLSNAPVALSGLWSRLEVLAQRACQADDAAPVLAEIAQRPADIEVDPAVHAAALRDFLEPQTLGSIEAIVRRDHPGVNLREVLLALGLLLQPVPASGMSQLDKGLRLPLPSDPLYAPLVGAFWCQLITPFLARGDFELALFAPSAQASGSAWLSVGFAGGSATTLQAMFDDQKAAEAFVALLAPDWVEAEVSHDYAVKKLSSYLQQPQLSIAQALSTFKECFLGV
jgi:type VI secretion system protein ImpM